MIERSGLSVEDSTQMSVAESETSGRESQIDSALHHMYGLAEEERTAVERSLGLIHATDEEEDEALARWAEEGEDGGAGEPRRGDGDIAQRG